MGKPYGLTGFMKVRAFTEYGGDILKYNPWYLTKDTKEWRKIEVLEGTIQKNGHIIVKFRDFNTPEDAKLLSGSKIAILREQAPPLKQNEYYWSDLIGLTVINQEGKVLGQVVDLLATGSNDVLVVKNHKEFAVPFLLEEVIQKIDLQKKEIHVKWDLDFI